VVRKSLSREMIFEQKLESSKEEARKETSMEMVPSRSSRGVPQNFYKGNFRQTLFRRILGESIALSFHNKDQSFIQIVYSFIWAI
jgi:hypothetical protein